MKCKCGWDLIKHHRDDYVWSQKCKCHYEFDDLVRIIEAFELREQKMKKEIESLKKSLSNINNAISETGYYKP